METHTVGLHVLLLCALSLGVGVTAGATSVDAGAESPGMDGAHEFEVNITETSAAVEGEQLGVTVAVENVGTGSGTETVTLQTPGLGTDSTEVTLAGGATETVALSTATEIEDAAGSPYTVIVTSAGDTDTEPVPVQLPPVGDFSNPPTDQTGDAQYEDIDGDTTFDIFDVQGLFTNLDAETVSTHPWAFDLDDDGIVDIFDVQALFGKLGGDPPGTAVFEVTLTQVPESVSAGDSLDIGYEVTNTGTAADTQDIAFSVNEQGVDTQSVSLAPGETFGGSFSYVTDPADVPGAAVGVASGEDAASATLAVDPGSPGNFQVTALDAPSGVQNGATLTVNYTVENTADIVGTQDIAFLVEGMEETTESVTLGAGETGTGSFAYDTSSASGDSVSVGVSTANASQSASVDLLAPANFQLPSVDAPAEVVAGEPLVVEYTATNTGEVAGTQDIEFLVFSIPEELEPDVSLAPGETFNGSFTYDTAGQAGNTLSGALSTANATEFFSTSVAEPAQFDVATLEAPAAVEAGDPLTVDYTVENTGGVSGTQDIEFLVDGTQADVASDVTLDTGETTSGSFTYDTGDDGGQTLSVTVSTDDDSTSTSVEVEQPPNFQVVALDAPAEVTGGDPLPVEYTVQNVGDITDTQDVTFLVDGAQEGLDSGITLVGGETASGSFTYDTTGAGGTTLSTAVTTDNDTNTTAVTVTPPTPTFELTAFDAPAEVTAGEFITVGYTVENTGELAGTQDIEFLVNGSSADTEPGVSLAVGETFNGSFSYNTTAGDGDTVLTVAVSTDNDTQSSSVAVPSPDLSVSINESQGAVGETIQVGVDIVSVEGTGNSVGSYSVAVSFDDAVLNFTDVVGVGWNDPLIQNDFGDGAAFGDFSSTESTPAEPAVVIEFEVVGDGTSAIEFDDEVSNGGNEFNDENTSSYNVLYDDGAAGTSVSGTAAAGGQPEHTDAAARLR